jgi:polysaccharide chain length determinant protein (PEP-CTERM system associated)
MQALIDTVLNELRGMWRFRRFGLAVVWGVCLIGWAVVYMLPDRYESRARVNVDTRTALRPLLQGLAVDQDVESQLNQVRQALLGRTNLEKVAQKVGLTAAATTPLEREQILAGLGSRLEIALEPPAVRDPRIPNTLYRIVYTDESRDRALRVVDTLLNSFVEDTMGGERSGTASAQRFLREQLADYERRLAESEGALAEFKKKNLGLVPGEEGDYFQRLQAENADIKRVEGLLSVATSRRTELSRQLSGEIPFVPPADGATRSGGNNSTGPQDTASRIQETQSRLDELLLRFTERHPDVIAATETLEQLRARQQQELAALRRGDAGAAAVAGASSNPVYQNIQLQLNQVDVEIAALRGQLNDLRRSVGQLRQLVDTAPEVEAEYKRLTRDYDVTRTQYNALLERLERARLSEGAEQTGIVRFDVVDPPSANFGPVFPNRPLFLTAVLIFAIGAGAGVTFLMHQVKPVFSSARNLADLTGLPVLGAVSRTWLEKQRAEMRGGLMRYAAVSGLLLALFVVVVSVQQPASRLLRQIL